MTMFSFNRAAMRPSSPARNPSTSSADRQPFAVRLAADALVIAGILALFGLIAWILPAIGEPIGPKGVPSSVSTNLADLPYYALRSVFRMFVALFFSLVFTFVYGHHYLDGAVPRFDAGCGSRVDFRHLHQSGMEYGVLVHPIPDQRAARTR